LCCCASHLLNWLTDTTFHGIFTRRVGVTQSCCIRPHIGRFDHKGSCDQTCYICQWCYSEVERSLFCSLTVLHAWCASALSCWKQNLSPETSLIAVNICWNSVVKYLTDSTHWLSVLAEKTPITDMVPNIMATVCISDSWMLCTLSCLVHTVDHLMNEG